MIRSMPKEKFLQTGALYADGVQEAFVRYKSAVVCGCGLSSMRTFLERILLVNGKDAYADFYYSVLKPEEQTRFKKNLAKASERILQQFETDKRQIFYPLDRESLGFLFEITAESRLFSTFYFTNRKITVWGNYNLEFPIFCEDDKTLLYYIELAENCGLEIKE